MNKIGCQNTLDIKLREKNNVWYCKENNQMVTIQDCKKCKLNKIAEIDKQTMQEKIKQENDKKVDYVNEILTLYTNDEIGEKQEEKYLKMSRQEKINLYNNAKSMSNKDDFDTDIVINFDYNNY